MTDCDRHAFLGGTSKWQMDVHRLAELHGCQKLVSDIPRSSQHHIVHPSHWQDLVGNLGFDAVPVWPGLTIFERESDDKSQEFQVTYFSRKHQRRILSKERLPTKTVVTIIMMIIILIIVIIINIPTLQSELWWAWTHELMNIIIFIIVIIVNIIVINIIIIIILILILIIIILIIIIVMT